MTKVDLPYINVQRGRDGRVRHWYFRRHGHRWALPGEPLSWAFMEEYQRLLTETDKPAANPPADRRSYASGSFGLLVNEYLASAEYREKKPSTKLEYRRVLEALQELHGSKPVNQTEAAAYTPHAGRARRNPGRCQHDRSHVEDRAQLRR